MLSIFNPISDIPGIGPFYIKKFHKLGIKRIEDLFYHVPHRYIDYSKISTIKGLTAGETVTIHATVISITNIVSRRGVRMQIGSVEDPTGKLTVVWFNQLYLTKMLYPGRLVSLSGKVGFFNRKLCLSSPDYEILDSEEGETTHTGRLLPIYPETANLSSKVLRSKIKSVYQSLTPLPEFLPQKLLTENNLSDFDQAVKLVHFPDNENSVEKGLERLAYNEMLFMHLKSLHRKSDWKKIKSSIKIKADDQSILKFKNHLPFKLTASQETAITEILTDLQSDIPMNRLLEGDVGSGKTVVAAAAAYLTYLNKFKTIIMAPTQILAEQHFKTLEKILSPLGLKIALKTAAVKNYDMETANVIVGTHALIHHKNGNSGKKGKFSNTGLIVIDEQHRFGVEQRSHLVDKSGNIKTSPHVLTMTATPIPRTIALTSYGDLDLSVLTSSPLGRQEITTWVVPEVKRPGAYEWIAKEVAKSKSQVFWVCPLIMESEKETMEGVKAVTQEFEILRKVFPKLKLALLHGKMKNSEKQNVLDSFRDGSIDILVSTPVVEVGIDVPNATIMVVETAERFGLAALHQLRGRVGRGAKKSYCLLFSKIKSGDAFKRLKAMEKTHSGFELAELDLKLRGPGEIFGTMQSGFSELKVASWSNFELIKKTRQTAEDVIKNPEDYPFLAEKLNTQLLVA
jgi:ATP-dependent DNA helicase RecG